jgi:hypothetical protein
MKMAACQTSTKGGDGSVPIACALTSADLAEQRAKWERLMAQAMTDRVPTADGVCLRFGAEPGVERELRRLAAVENECCPWAEWAVRTDARGLVLDIRSTGDGVAAVHAMFAGQEPPGLVRR